MGWFDRIVDAAGANQAGQWRGTPAPWLPTRWFFVVDVAFQAWLALTLGSLVLLAVVVLVQGLVAAVMRAVRAAAGAFLPAAQAQARRFHLSAARH